MDLTADDYERAAAERLEQARRLHNEATPRGETTHHALTIYVAGVAVECLLRGLILRRTKVLDTGHDLTLLFQHSKLGDIEKARPIDAATKERIEAKRIAIAEAVLVVRSSWLNGLRYAPESRLRKGLFKKKLLVGIKGDAVREQARSGHDRRQRRTLRMDPLKEKIVTILQCEFPPPASIRVRGNTDEDEPEEPWYAVFVTSDAFEGVPILDRSAIAWKLLKANLSIDERSRIAIVVPETWDDREFAEAQSAS